MELAEDTRYEIRPATPADIPELIRMQTALQQDMDGIRRNLLRPNRASVAGLREYYSERIQDDQTRLLVALTVPSAETVGMCAGKVWMHADYLPPLSGELIDLWIDPGHRRKSLARRILAQLLRFFHHNSVDFLVVSYVQGNLLGEDLWNRLGFEPVLITATAARKDMEQALGVPIRQAAPPAYRTVLAARSTARLTSVPAV